WPRPTPRVVRFLADAPLIVRDRDGLAALAALPPEEPAEPRLALRLWRRWEMPGLERLYAVSAVGWHGWRKGDEPPPPGRLRLCAAGLVEDVLASARDAARLARAAG
ncbi:MAG TPA: hypothetical protein VFY87_08990, partial [Geminicoccaceae bacterium]|nr:hypothetical protein [Geminicoccaceae bacterium]